jgi:7-carboxy-7-deazaguanine synthase
MTVLRVNDCYACVQGEGCQAGLAMVLLRLHGCGVGCPFCDTKETWEVDTRHAVPSIREALGATPKYTVTDPYTVARYIAVTHIGPKWIMVTGGEPADQPLAELVDALHAIGYKVAIETSGTATGLIGASFDWVCVSPKIGMPGGRTVLREVVEVADEIKFVIGKPNDLRKLDDLLDRCRPRPEMQICLQPMSQSKAATQFCISTVQDRGWRLSVQMHKYLALP